MCEQFYVCDANAAVARTMFVTAKSEVVPPVAMVQIATVHAFGKYRCPNHLVPSTLQIYGKLNTPKRMRKSIDYRVNDMVKQPFQWLDPKHPVYDCLNFDSS